MLNPETIPFGTTSFEGWDMSLSENAVPKDIPVLFIPGWGKTPRTYAEGIQGYVRAGRRVLTLSFPTKENKYLASITSKNRFPRAQMNRASALIALLDAREVEKVDVIAHSEGCMNVLIAADLFPERFRNLVLIAPPGLTGRESRFHILWHVVRSGAQLWQDMMSFSPEEQRRYQQGMLDTRAWLKQRGFVRGSIEGMEPGRIDVRSLLCEVKTHGHGVSIIAAEKDRMLPIGQFRRAIADGLPIDVFYSVAGGHRGFYLQPERYAAIIERALKELCC